MPDTTVTLWLSLMSALKKLATDVSASAVASTAASSSATATSTADSSMMLPRRLQLE